MGYANFCSVFSTSFCKNSTNSLVKLRSYWTNFHNVFKRCRAIHVAFNTCIYKPILHFVLERQSKEWRQSISTSAKRTKNKLVTITMFLGYRDTYVSFIIRIYICLPNAEVLVIFGLVLAEIFGKICRFWPSRPKSYRNSWSNLWGYWTNRYQCCPINIAL